MKPVTDRILDITVETPKDALPYIAVHVELAATSERMVVSRGVIPLDLHAADVVVSKLVGALGHLRDLDNGAAARAAQEAAEAATGVVVGDTVVILEGSCAGREAEVIEVYSAKIVVWRVQGLIAREKLQLLPKQFRRK
jgi:hypothetical protein